MAKQELDAESINPYKDTKVDTIFVDQPCSFQSGPYVTKITLGVDENDGADFPRPTITIAMPTVNLMRMVEDLQKVFLDPEFKHHNLLSIQEDLKNHYGIPGVAAPIKKTRRLRDG